VDIAATPEDFRPLALKLINESECIPYRAATGSRCVFAVARGRLVVGIVRVVPSAAA
jgi:hypothetical protein